MNPNKKEAVIISCLSVLFIMPIISYAVVYQSNVRENKFNPAKAEIQIKESEEPKETQTSEYTGETDAEGNYNVEKTVQIYDVRDKNDEYLRVRFIPMWYDTDGNVVGGVDNYSDFSTVALDNDTQSQAAELQYKSSSDVVLLKLQLCTDPNSHWSNSWRYESSEQCFYYKGKIQSGDISATLLSGVQIPKSVYDAASEYTLHIEVLADAIQTSGNAKNDRWGNS